MATLPRIEIDLSLFTDGLTRQGSEKIILYLLEALIKADTIQMSEVSIPKLYESGVRYVADYETPEWKGAIRAFQDKTAECKDLAAWRCAEYRKAGIAAMPHLFWRSNDRTGQLLYHVVCRLPTGRFEDPSRMLGMGKDPGKPWPYPRLGRSYVWHGKPERRI